MAFYKMVIGKGLGGKREECKTNSNSYTRIQLMVKGCQEPF